MGVFRDIQTILDTKLGNMPGRPPIAWPNVKFNPAQSQIYLRPTLLPAPTALYSLGDYKEYSGIYQVDVFTAAEKGNGVTLGLMDDVKNHYLSELNLTNGVNTVLIQAVSMGPILREDAWAHGVVEINYLCYSK